VQNNEIDTCTFTPIPLITTKSIYFILTPEAPAITPEVSVSISCLLSSMTYPSGDALLEALAIADPIFEVHFGADQSDSSIPSMTRQRF
jgi:hypothetical protein